MNNVDILVPNLPESVSDAIIAVWHKKIGESIQRGEILVELETDKIMLEIPATESGVLETIFKNVGSIVTSGQILGNIKMYNIVHEETVTNSKQTTNILQSDNMQCIDTSKKVSDKETLAVTAYPDSSMNDLLTPSIRRLMHEHNLKPELIKGTGLDGRITRKDIENYLTHRHNDQFFSKTESLTQKKYENRTETRVPMSRLRQQISKRLLKVKNSTAMLTTFNEVNMKPIIELRKQYGEIFETRHNIRLGFMSFYVKAVSEALKYFPEINASLDNENIVYYNYFDISIAVSTSRGLVTPVLRDVNLLSISEIEKEIKNLASKGRDGKLTVEELTGGTFTITNGGVFGSLMSTPIINPPQSAILGMHTIKDRPMAINNQIIILPMMYLALSYDHRLIDGKDAISFLIKVKDILEDPIRFLLEV